MQLIADGLAGSPSLDAARAQARRARAAAAVSRAPALLPQVSGNGEITYQRYSGELHLPAAARRQLADRQPR